MEHLFSFNESNSIDKVNYIYRHLNAIASFINGIFPPEICNILEKCYSGACIYKKSIETTLNNSEIDIIYHFLCDKYGDLDIFAIQDYLLGLSDKIGKNNIEVEIEYHGYQIFIHTPPLNTVDFLLDILSEIKQIEKRIDKKLRIFTEQSVITVWIYI